jgi:serine-threonine kinase receptor-associated protein
MPMLRDGGTGDWIGTWAGHKGAVWSCRLDSTASLAATASGDFSVRVWDAITGKTLWTYPHKHIVKACDFSPDSTKLATGGHEGILRIYDMLQQCKMHPKQQPVQPLEIPMDKTKKIIIGKLNWLNDDTVLCGCADGTIRFFHVPAAAAADTPPQQHQMPVGTLTTDSGAEIRDMEITTIQSTGQRILTVAAGTKVYFFDTGTNKLLKSYKMPIHFREEGGASLHPVAGTKFIAGGSDLWVRVFDYETGHELECLKGHHGPIRCLRYSPDGSLYASGSEDGTIRLWQDTP